MPVWQSCLSTVNLPFGHPSHAGVSFGQRNTLAEEADFILILDSDIPWMPLHTKVSPKAEVFHIDCDPLKEKMLFHAFPARIRAKADCAIALEQLIDYLEANPDLLDTQVIESRRTSLVEKAKENDANLKALEVPASGDILTAPLIVSTLRKHSEGKRTLVCNEAISNYPHVWNHMAPTEPGSLLSSGASSLGWALGAAVGAQLAGQVISEAAKDLVAVVVGDGSFVFGVPSAAFWMARRYETVRAHVTRPILPRTHSNDSRSTALLDHRPEQWRESDACAPSNRALTLLLVPTVTGLEIAHVVHAGRTPERTWLEDVCSRLERFVWPKRLAQSRLRRNRGRCRWRVVEESHESVRARVGHEGGHSSGCRRQEMRFVGLLA